MSYGVHPYAIDFELLREYATDTRSLTRYGLKDSCTMLTKMLSNEFWSAMRSSWFDEVDQALMSSGPASSFSDTHCQLGGRGTPSLTGLFLNAVRRSFQPL